MTIVYVKVDPDSKPIRMGSEVILSRTRAGMITQGQEISISAGPRILGYAQSEPDESGIVAVSLLEYA